MTHGLYELIGAQRGATVAALQAAYTRALAQLVRRRRALVEQGGDTGKIDLARAQLDEAWAVLSDPAGRRRYDALLALTEGGDLPPVPELWDRTMGSVASPAAVAAVEVVRALTDLQVQAMPAAVGAAEAAPTDHGDHYGATPDTQADVPTEAFGQPESRARPIATVLPSAVVRFPGGSEPDATPVAAESRPPSEPRADLRVVEGRGAAAPVVRLPVEHASTSGSSELDLDALVAEVGWSGALLGRVREHKGMSLRDVGDATRISARYLEAIEQDDFEHLPSSTFVKGYLREMARTLGLDEAALVRGYMRRMGG